MAVDPMPFNISDTFLILEPRSEWPDPGARKEAVREKIEAVVERIPGASYEFTQPIEMRFNELLAGVRGDLAVKIFGDRFEELIPAARRIEALLREVPGGRDIRMEQVSGAPVLRLDVDPSRAGRYGLSVGDVHEVVAIAVGGRPAGEIFEGDRRFDVLVRLPERRREDLRSLGRLPIPLPPREPNAGGDGVLSDRTRRIRTIPLDSVAQLHVEEGPNQISRENGVRRGARTPGALPEPHRRRSK